MIRLASSLAMAIALAAAPALAQTAPSATEPSDWVKRAEAAYLAQLNKQARAEWVYSNFITDDTAAILSGVTEGELIATAGVHKLETGQKVKPLLPRQQAAR